MVLKTRSRLEQLRDRLLLLAVIYLFLRLLFFIINIRSFAELAQSDILTTFLHGLRYDLSALLYVNIPLILLALFTFIPAKYYDKLSHWFYLVINIPFILINTIDLEYFKFSGRRITAEFFALKDDIISQSGQLVLSYWYLTFVFLILSYVLYHLSQKWMITDLPESNLAKNLLRSFLVILCTVFGIRGGTQKKVLKPGYAHTIGGAAQAPLALNSTFTLLHSLKSPAVKPVRFYHDDALAVAELPKPEITRKFRHEKKLNVVLIILESFATEFWGAANKYPGYTPFLDSLTKEGAFFKFNFANGRRSIEALPSILMGVPSLMQIPIANSNYQQNQWVGLPKILKAHGYETHFFHGAPKGSMYFDTMAAMAGFGSYHGLEEYPEKSHYDGNWGIFDEPYLQYVAKQLNGVSKPFFATVFTLSSHQPYRIPPEYAGKLKKGPLPIQETISYVDQALEKFFSSIKKTDWYEDTLFVFTGDHTQMSESINYNTPLGGFMVPLLFYRPNTELKADESRITQHTDVPASVLDYLNVNSSELSLFSRSVFNDELAGEAILHLDGNFWLVRKDYFLKFHMESQTYQFFRFDDKGEKMKIDNLPPEISEPFKKRLQAYIQYYNNSLLLNKIFGYF